jgi:citrate synthase
MADSVASGLEGVVVADTALSEVDGERGRLVIAGHDVEELGGHCSFEELCAELWAAMPGRPPLPSYDARWAGSGSGPSSSWSGSGGRCWPRTAWTRSGVGWRRFSPRAVAGDLAVRLTAATAVFTAAWWRRREGLAPLAPNPEADHPRTSSGCSAARPPPTAPPVSRPIW